MTSCPIVPECVWVALIHGPPRSMAPGGRHTKRYGQLRSLEEGRLHPPFRAVHLQALREMLIFARSGTRSPLTSSSGAPGSATSRSSWATARSRPPRSTPTSRSETSRPPRRSTTRGRRWSCEEEDRGVPGRSRAGGVRGLDDPVEEGGPGGLRGGGILDRAVPEAPLPGAAPGEAGAFAPQGLPPLRGEGQGGRGDPAPAGPDSSPTEAPQPGGGPEASGVA